MTRLGCILILLAGWMGGCCSTQPECRINRSGTVNHTVLFWFKTPGDATTRAQLVTAAESFRTIPGVLDMQYGQTLSSDRPVVDDSFDLAVVVTLRNESALEAYLAHPVHQAAVAATVKPLVERFQVYDFRLDSP